MHHVFWVMFAVMVVYAIMAHPRPIEAPEGSSVEPEPRWPVVGWLALAAAGLGAVIYLTGYVNNTTTMATANTRWPVWAWPDGPFPGRDATR